MILGLVEILYLVNVDSYSIYYESSSTPNLCRLLSYLSLSILSLSLLISLSSYYSAILLYLIRISSSILISLSIATYYDLLSSSCSLL